MLDTAIRFLKLYVDAVHYLCYFIVDAVHKQWLSRPHKRRPGGQRMQAFAVKQIDTAALQRAYFKL